ncbi:YqcI/YcgG family-domain-containing protein [Aspergillus multicolor]|uniref:YqcI/YcgG family protein n=1 Tax=Aspergillus multicolor TaxID=41759 RepID=UPI003CCD19B8
MEHRYLFLESDDMQDHTCTSAATLSAALKTYLDTAPSDLGPNTSLVVLFPIPTSPQSTSLSVMDYHQKYWNCLRALRRSDPKAWPSHIPTDTDSPLWRFCFNGQPLFSAALTPAHEKRRSRYAPCFGIVFQPNFVFDILFATPLKKQSAIDKVRGLLARFDDVPMSPELKNYGDPTGRESKQYFILDRNEDAVGCPWETLDA